MASSGLLLHHQPLSNQSIAEHVRHEQALEAFFGLMLRQTGFMHALVQDLLVSQAVHVLSLPVISALQCVSNH